MCVLCFHSGGGEKSTKMITLGDHIDAIIINDYNNRTTTTTTASTIKEGEVPGKASLLSQINSTSMPGPGQTPPPPPPPPTTPVSDPALSPYWPCPVSLPSLQPLPTPVSDPVLSPYRPCPVSLPPPPPLPDSEPVLCPPSPPPHHHHLYIPASARGWLLTHQSKSTSCFHSSVPVLCQLDCLFLFSVCGLVRMSVCVCEQVCVCTRVCVCVSSPLYFSVCVCVSPPPPPPPPSLPFCFLLVLSSVLVACLRGKNLNVSVSLQIGRGLCNCIKEMVGNRLGKSPGRRLSRQDYFRYLWILSRGDCSFCIHGM